MPLPHGVDFLLRAVYFYTERIGDCPSSVLPGQLLEPGDFLEISGLSKIGYSPEKNYPEFFPETRLKKSSA
jgi:hypothetical protein